MESNTTNTQTDNTENKIVYNSTLLFVDDERNILSSLKRLFRPLGYRIFLANGGAEGLEILRQEQVDLVISDMRMPEMDGAEFLEKVAAQWPDTVRLLLTGYADISSTIAAINKGKIHQYISKPWNDNDIKITVEQALKFRLLEAERDELLELSHKQNEELKEFNTNLEGLVKSRTDELEQTMGMLEVSYQTLKDGYSSAIKVFSNLIELREGSERGNSRKVADQVQKLALSLGMDEEQAQQVSYAGMLCDIGKVGFSDDVFNKPVALMNDKDKEQYFKHPILGEAILMTLDPLKMAAKIIRHYRECYDGEGFPDKLTANNIPLGSRILSVVSDFYALQAGRLIEGGITAKDAQEFIASRKGANYDPQVVDAFIKQQSMSENLSTSKDQDIYKIQSVDLKEGMILARDINIKDGVLLLSKDHSLGPHVIKQIGNLERTLKETLEIFVYK